jgi:predicted site-specific integrase-resolvase
MAAPEMTVVQFAQRLGIPRSTAYLAVKLGQIDVINIATSPLRKRLRITEAAYQRYLKSREIKGRRSAA